MTCNDHPPHDGIPCWTWTCQNGPGCGHGHHDDGGENRASYEHMLAHAVDAGLISAPAAADALEKLVQDTSHWKTLGLTGKVPYASMEHAAPHECDRCKLLKDAGLAHLAEAAAAVQIAQPREAPA
jgi:hypothetical protein